MHETRSGQRSEEQLGGAGGASGLLPLTRGSIIRENDKEKVHPSKHSQGQRSRETTPTPVQSGPVLVSDQPVPSAQNIFQRKTKIQRLTHRQEAAFQREEGQNRLARCHGSRFTGHQSVLVRLHTDYIREHGSVSGIDSSLLMKLLRALNAFELSGLISIHA